MNIPGFNAESSLSPNTSTYREKPGSRRFSAAAGGAVVPQFLIHSGLDLGAYLRCKANGGSETICRFFGGFDFFTIGRFLRR
jgi:hypothetical protein